MFSLSFQVQSGGASRGRSPRYISAFLDGRLTIFFVDNMSIFSNFGLWKHSLLGLVGNGEILFS